MIFQGVADGFGFSVENPVKQAVAMPLSTLQLLLLEIVKAIEARIGVSRLVAAIRYCSHLGHLLAFLYGCGGTASPVCHQAIPLPGMASCRNN